MPDDNVKPFKRPDPKPAREKHWLEDAFEAFQDAGVDPADCYRTDDDTDWIKPVDNVTELQRKPEESDEK